MKVLILNERLTNLYDYSVSLGYDTEITTIEKLKSCDYPKDVDIIAGAMEFKLLKREDLEKFKNLKYIFLFSVGIDYMDLDFVKEKGIIMTNNHGAYSEPIAEWVIYNLLQIEKKNKTHIKQQLDHNWNRLSHGVGTMYDKNALFLGTGAISKEAVKRIKPFVKKVVGVNTRGTEVEGFDEVIKTEEIKNILKEMDYVVSFLPSTYSTYKMMNEEFFSTMKKGSVFVNISRGTVVDEEALIKYLENGHIRAAALDVTFKEPLDKNSKLWDMEDVYISPHTSDAAEDFVERRAMTAKVNLKNLKEGKDLINVVNFKKGY